MTDVAIIGAGVTGGMIARLLSRYDCSVCILEKECDVAMGASKANSGIVQAGFDAYPGSLKALLNVRGAAMMERTAAELGVTYRKNGAFVVGFGEDDYKTISSLYDRGAKNGVKNLYVISGREARALEENLSEEITCALYAPESAIINPYELTLAAVGNAMDNGAELKYGFEVMAIEKNGDKFDIYSDREKITARRVINAAGLFADRIAAMAGDESFDIHPRRGEYMLLDKESCHISHTVFPTPSKMGKGILVSPTADGNLLLGPTSHDMRDKTDKSVYNEGFEEIREKAEKAVNNINFGAVITSFCGLRAVGSTGDFIINSPCEGFINVAGIESPGLTSSPAAAEFVLDLLKKDGFDKKEKQNCVKERKSYHWFSALTNEEKNKVIKKDASFGRIVCRCEGISEGEIKEAIKRNPPAQNTDAVKRRTRAGMGRCQSGFCLPSAAVLLAKEMGIKLEEVTKSGKNSHLNKGHTKEVR